MLTSQLTGEEFRCNEIIRYFLASRNETSIIFSVSQAHKPTTGVVTLFKILAIGMLTGTHARLVSVNTFPRFPDVHLIV